MKKIIMSLMVIAVTVGLVAGGTFADFSDYEVSDDNFFATAALDLKVSDYLGQVYDGETVPAMFQITDAWPSCDKSIFFDLHNEGQGFQKIPYAYIHIKNVECGWVMPKTAYKWINCDPATGECIVATPPADPPFPGDQGVGLPKPVNEPEYVAECGGVVGEDRYGNPVTVTGIGCCYGEDCELARHVDVHIEVAGPYPNDVYPTSETVPDADWVSLDLTAYDDDPDDGVIKMNELDCEEILLAQIPNCNKIWVHIWMHLQDIDEDVALSFAGVDNDGDGAIDEDGRGCVGDTPDFDDDNDGLIDEDPAIDANGGPPSGDPDGGYFDANNAHEAKWDHWVTNAIQKDKVHFDMAFELLQNPVP